MSDKSGSDKLWGGRFSSDLDETMLRFSESTEPDGEMVAEDIWGSQAHALMLAECGIITRGHLREILTWLEKAREEFEAGRLTLKVELEDVHMNVESYLREGAGPEAGGRLHTARSRNDQVVTDFRMRLRRWLLDIRAALAELRAALLDLAEGVILEIGRAARGEEQPVRPVGLGVPAAPLAGGGGDYPCPRMGVPPVGGQGDRQAFRLRVSPGGQVVEGLLDARHDPGIGPVRQPAQRHRTDATRDGGEQADRDVGPTSCHRAPPPVSSSCFRPLSSPVRPT